MHWEILVVMLVLIILIAVFVSMRQAEIARLERGFSDSIVSCQANEQEVSVPEALAEDIPADPVEDTGVSDEPLPDEEEVYVPEFKE